MSQKICKIYFFEYNFNNKKFYILNLQNMAKTKMKLFWLSKAGKILFKTILWIVVWIFAIVWFIAIRMFSIQLKNYEYLWWAFANTDEMIDNMLYDLWYSRGWMMNNYKFNIFWMDIFKVPEDEKWLSILERTVNYDIEKEAIIVDDDFTWIEITETPFWTNLKFPYSSWNKYFDTFWEAIYWDETNERGDPIRIWNRIYEIKIELTNAKNYGGDMFRNNSKHKHFREKWILYSYNSFKRYSNSTEPLKEWESACIILTPLNPITATDKSLHDENCEFWHINEAYWYDELYVQFSAQRDTTSKTEIKITPISIDVPIFTNIGKTDR